MACPACLVCFINTVNGCIKKRRLESQVLVPGTWQTLSTLFFEWHLAHVNYKTMEGWLLGLYGPNHKIERKVSCFKFLLTSELVKNQLKITSLSVWTTNNLRWVELMGWYFKFYRVWFFELAFRIKYLYNDLPQFILMNVSLGKQQ